MILDAPESHTFTATLDCRYLVHAPASPNGPPLLVLALHGYGSNPEAMLRLTGLLLGEQHVIAALQAPNQHYPAAPAPYAAAAYNWGIRDHWATSVRLHHAMVQEAARLLQDRFGLGPRRTLLVGFSQPVGLNYRFIGTYPDAAGAVLGICGGVPRDWEEEKYQPINAPILHISRDQDEFYPNETVAEFPRRLREHAKDVEFHLIPGPHRFPSKAKGVVLPWIERVFGA
jgi:predicted esterase